MPSLTWHNRESDLAAARRARLKDGRLFVIEYKGSDRFTADQEKEKRLVGDLWAKRSGGRGVYLMARKKDDQGRGVRDQLLAAIGGV